MTVQPPVYLDYHATTPCDPRVFEAMRPAFCSAFGNSSSRQHAFGRQADELVERARKQVAGLIRCDPREIVFTSGATESNNLAIKGVARAYRSKGRHIVTSVIEHKAVLDSCEQLEAEGFRVTYLPVGRDGRVRPADVRGAIGEGTTLVTIMWANNEIGTINPVGEIGAVCRERKVLFHCDGVQALAYLPCDVKAMGIDLLSVSAHKMYGPKGIGALYVRRRDPRVRLEPIAVGGGHERGMRSGTLNVPGIVGLAKACELVEGERESDSARVGELRDRLLAQLRRGVPELVVNGSLKERLPNNLNVSFPGLGAERLLGELKTVAVSTGSACTTASLDGSYVLKSLYDGGELASQSIRIGLGRFTTAEEIDYAAREIVDAVQKLGRQQAESEAGEAGENACDPRPAVR